MLALQIVLIGSAAVGLILSYLEFQRAQGAYVAWRDGEENGLGLQVAASGVRIAVLAVVGHLLQLVIAGLVLTVMWFRFFDWDLALIQLSGLSMLALVTTLKQLVIRYDYSLIMDAAVLKLRARTPKPSARPGLAQP